MRKPKKKDHTVANAILTMTAVNDKITLNWKFSHPLPLSSSAYQRAAVAVQVITTASMKVMDALEEISDDGKTLNKVTFDG